jgi:LmbE family N-acetylglucosaminyl deacetylase
MFEQKNPKTDILAIGSHPDDLEHAIGGSLLIWRSQGLSVELVHLTDGSAGSVGTAKLRREEAKAAAALLHSPVRFLDFHDARIRDDEKAREKIVRLIREVRPRTILAPYYDYPHMHPDHEETGKMVRGSIRLAGIKGFAPDDAEPFAVRRAFYYLFPRELKPAFVMDIGSVLEKWRELAWCYKSQLEGLEGYWELVQARKGDFAAPEGVRWGEAFYSDLPLRGNTLRVGEL